MRRNLAALAAAGVLLAGCSSEGDAAPVPSPASSTSTPTTGEGTDPTDGPADDPALDVALSEPVEDRVYPDVGDPGVDALHYDLDLTWDPDSEVLTGAETLTFRSTADDDSFRLDLGPELEVFEVTLDGEPVEHEQDGKDLVVTADVAADERYVVEIGYSGVPEPVAAPTGREDLASLGWTTMPDGDTWTMQEPFGAYSWYAVNDHPSDKALYDFTLRAPDRMVGVANGELESRETVAGQEVTEWHLAEPAASYLVTVAFGDYVTAQETSASGVPVSVWLPADEAARMPELRRTTVASLDWAEEVLGPYPFDSLGFLFVDSLSGMETQTMVTLGLSDYATSEPVLVHEAVHQWWGNQVTPRDWRDLWMNEGMTMYLQLFWESEHGGPPLDERLAGLAAEAPELRADSGPPAAYDPRAFAERNVYYLPALMWHDVRDRIGDDEFFRLVRAWPASRDNGHADYDDITDWWEDQSGEELTATFRRHLLAKRQPAYTP